jgi:hypothetical protein
MAQHETGFQVWHQEGIDLRINDPALGYAHTIKAPGKGDKVDAVFYDIMTSPIGLRSLGINQLSKSEIEETYPGQTDFQRWQHVSGVYHIVRHFARQQNLNEENTLLHALVACLPDLGHGVKSHVTDMLNEGMGGDEKFHEKRIGQVIELGGIRRIFEKYNIQDPFNGDGTFSIKVPSWIESSSPDLSVDRLHYIAAEASLLFPDTEVVRDAIKLENFTITSDGHFAFQDVDQARVWAKAANLCSSEHWNEPTNRLIELLSLEAMKRTIAVRYLEGVDNFDNGYVGTPEDYTFLIDKDFDEALEREALSQRPDVFMNAIYSLMQSIAHGERQRFVRHKRPAYEQYLVDTDAREYPNALINPHRAAFGIPPAEVEIKEGTGSSDPKLDAVLRMSNGRVIGDLKQLNPRQYDPLVMAPGGVARLSQLDPNFEKCLEESNQAISYVGEVALHANPESQQALMSGAEENAAFIEKSKGRQALSSDQIRGIITNSGGRALQQVMAEGRWISL